MEEQRRAKRAMPCMIQKRGDRVFADKWSKPTGTGFDILPFAASSTTIAHNSLACSSSLRLLIRARLRSNRFCFNLPMDSAVPVLGSMALPLPVLAKSPMRSHPLRNNSTQSMSACLMFLASFLSSGPLTSFAACAEEGMC